MVQLIVFTQGLDQHMTNRAYRIQLRMRMLTATVDNSSQHHGNYHKTYHSSKTWAHHLDWGEGVAEEEVCLSTNPYDGQI